MNTILEPLFAVLAIVVPLGMAYVIVLLQSRKSACGHRKASAITHDDSQWKMTEISRAVEKHEA